MFRGFFSSNIKLAIMTLFCLSYHFISMTLTSFACSSLQQAQDLRMKLDLKVTVTYGKNGKKVKVPLKIMF